MTLQFKRSQFRNGWTTFNVRDEDADEAEKRLIAPATPAAPGEVTDALLAFVKKIANGEVQDHMFSSLADEASSLWFKANALLALARIPRSTGTSDERTSFETWASATFKVPSFNALSNIYSGAHIQSMWMTWQARAALYNPAPVAAPAPASEAVASLKRLIGSAVNYPHTERSQKWAAEVFALIDCIATPTPCDSADAPVQQAEKEARNLE